MTKKKVVYVIEVTWDAEDLLDIGESVLDYLRRYGSAEVMNVYVDEETDDK